METLQCNYYGTLTATRNFLPLIRRGGRLVNISSMVGRLNSKYSQEIRTAFAESKTVNDVTKLMEDFTKAVEQGKEKEQGWPSAAYAVSKSGVTGMTRAIALEVAEGQTGKGVLVNSCCPGYVNTDMTKHRGAKTVDEGAQTPVFLACGDIGGKAGEFVSYSPKSFLPTLHPNSSHKTLRGNIYTCDCIVAQSFILKRRLLTGVRSGSEERSASGSSVFAADAEVSKMQQCNHVYNSNAYNHSPLIVPPRWNNLLT